MWFKFADKIKLAPLMVNKWSQNDALDSNICRAPDNESNTTNLFQATSMFPKDTELVEGKHGHCRQRAMMAREDCDLSVIKRRNRNSTTFQCSRATGTPVLRVIVSK
ncbi:hypothetical protein TNCV_4215031 [Trichonephila clavipes]|nr:hypothetical protein TNCV_4215031 [Trichonephila clavipes]